MEISVTLCSKLWLFRKHFNSPEPWYQWKFTVALMTPPAQDDFLSQYGSVHSTNLRARGVGCFPFPDVFHAGCCAGKGSSQVFNWADGSLKSHTGHIGLFPPVSMGFPRTCLLGAVALEGTAHSTPWAARMGSAQNTRAAKNWLSLKTWVPLADHWRWLRKWGARVVWEQRRYLCTSLEE